MKQFIQKYFKIVIWMAIILYISLTPASKIPRTNIFMIENFDKLVHFGMYFILSLIICSIIKIGDRKKIFIILLPILISVTTGGVLEIMQELLPINRSCSLGDFLANMSGAVVGALLYIYIPEKYKIKKLF
jgi:VanZ family protein